MAVDDYVLPLSRLVHQFKFSSQIALAQPLARLLLLAVLQARRTRGLPPVDTLVNVPLFQRRHWRRDTIKATCCVVRSPTGWVAGTQPLR